MGFEVEDKTWKNNMSYTDKNLAEIAKAEEFLKKISDLEEIPNKPKKDEWTEEFAKAISKNPDVSRETIFEEQPKLGYNLNPLPKKPRTSWKSEHSFALQSIEALRKKLIFYRNLSYIGIAGTFLFVIHLVFKHW